jgi:hypothetical protein
MVSCTRSGSAERKDATVDVSTNQNAPATWTPIDAAALSPQQILQRDHAVAARDAMFRQLFTRLSEAMQTPGPDGAPVGPAGAIGVCHEEAPAIARAIGQEMGVSIGRTSDRLRNPANTAPAWTATLLESRPDQPRFATSTDGSLGMTMPIKLGANCLACHGPTEQIAPPVRQAIAKLYPHDAAVGYAAGDIRGWFWVEVPQVINVAKPGRP